MSVLDVDLSMQKYPVFNTDEVSSVKLSEVNFIFGKNGTGKSSFSELINQQYGTDSDYDVYIYKGMQDLLVNNKLNSIVLGVENKEAKLKIDYIDSEIEEKSKNLTDLERQLKSLDWKDEYKDLKIKKHNLFILKKGEEEQYAKQKDLIDGFYTYGAKIIRDYDPSIRLVLGHYNKNNFKQEIKSAKKLNEKEANSFFSQIRDTPKEKISAFQKYNHNYQMLLNEVNNIITTQIKQLEIIPELENDNKKKDFAYHGRQLHRPGEKCSFCGQIYSEERAAKLERYFSEEDFKQLNSKIDNQILKIDEWLSELDSITEIKQAEVYDFLSDDLFSIISIIENRRSNINNFLQSLKNILNDKKKDVFIERELLDIEVPDSLNPLIDEVNHLIDNHNNFTDDFTNQQDIARNALRLNEIYEIISNKGKYPYKEEWEGYSAEKNNFYILRESLSKANNLLEQEIKKITGKEDDTSLDTICGLNNRIKSLEKNREEYLTDTKNTEYLAKIINEKLSSSGKKNLQLKVCNTDDDVECYMIMDENDGVRDISKVSTGEKNIIAFLYFIGNLKSKDSRRKKIIIFDDPMNSNDDTLQYLIITELQKLYRGTNKIFNRNKDIFICMTHNVHFHLNVQPQGYFKDENGKTKYDKNTFYILRDRTFFRVTNQSEDFKTSYEALWMELNDLYKNNYLNSMLNSMRRIVETFMKFNKIHQDKFYKDKDEHLKIFNVNSHEAIDELSADSIGKTKEELSSMFRELFVKNGYESHYNSYWKQ